MTSAAISRTKASGYPGFGILFLAWTVLGVLAYLRYFLLTGILGRGVLPELLGWLSCYYPWLFFSPLIFRLEDRFPLSKTHWARHVAILAPVGFLASYAAYELTMFLSAMLHLVFHDSVLLPRHWGVMPRAEFGLEQALYWFTVGCGCIIRNLMELRQQERLAAQLALEKSQLENTLRQAELETLRMRLNPHFLFNCLQNIHTLCQQDGKTAGQMLTRLGDLLRIALRRDAQPESTLAEELRLTQVYIAIEQMRFRDRLSVLLDIACGTETALVPVFLLQPLVENAIRHGLQGQYRTGAIWIRSSQRNDQLILTVTDNGNGISEQELATLKMGVGLSSTCERLARMYPERHAFSMRNLPEGGTEVSIALPFKRQPEGRDCPANEHPALVDRR
jgi:two-component system LytT family sensor kinase